MQRAMAVGRLAALAQQRRTCMTWMYHENNPGSVAPRKQKSRLISRDEAYGRDQKYDPDWVFKPEGPTGALRSHLHGVYAKERLTTYKLERMDYEVREVNYGTAPPPPVREVSTNITLDLL